MKLSRLVLCAVFAGVVVGSVSATAGSQKKHTTNMKEAVKSLVEAQPEISGLQPKELQELLQQVLPESEAMTYDTAADAFLCRRCGAVLFSRSDVMMWAQVPPSPMGLQSLRAEPALGPGALVPSFHETHGGGAPKAPHGLRDFMLFNLPQATDDAPELTPIIFNAASDPSKQLFEGYHSFAASCSGCNTPLGYFVSQEKSLVTTNEPDDSNAVAKSKTKPSMGVSPVAAAPSDPPPPNVKPHAREWEEGLLSQLLDGVCHVRYTGEWWSYEVCHGSGVSQLHLDKAGKAEVRWSLGVYKPSLAAERVRAPEALYDIHRFKGGQHCDETKAGRSSRVRYMCCFPSDSAQEATSTPVLAPGSGSTNKDKLPSAKQAWIASVVETALCQYTIEMCVLALCEQLPPSPAPGSKPAKPKAVPSQPTVPTAAPGSRTADGVQGPPKRFIAMDVTAVLPDTSDDLAWLEDHEPELGTK